MATILDLLAALNRGDLPPLPGPAKPVPIPYAPVPNLGPLSEDTTAAFGALNPEPVPPALAPPATADMNFVNQYAGTPPTAPAPLSRGQRIANALAGFGAGFQGNGAQFLQHLQEPQRRYEAQLADYKARRSQGLELADRRAERQQEMAQRAAEQRYEREYRTWEKKTGVRDEQAKTLLRQAFELNVIRERERIADEKQQRAIDAATEKQRRDIEDELATKDGAPAAIAREISEYRVGKRPSLSAAAERWRGLRAKKLERQLARVGGDGGSATGKNLVEIVDGQGRVLGRMPYSQVKFDDNTGEPRGFPGATIRFPQTQSQPTPTPQQADTRLPGFDFNSLLQRPSYMPAPTQEPSAAEVKAYAKRFRISPKKARQELMGQ